MVQVLSPADRQTSIECSFSLGGNRYENESNHAVSIVFKSFKLLRDLDFFLFIYKLRRVFYGGWTSNGNRLPRV